MLMLLQLFSGSLQLFAAFVVQKCIKIPSCTETDLSASLSLKLFSSGSDSQALSCDLIFEDLSCYQVLLHVCLFVG